MASKSDPSVIHLSVPGLSLVFDCSSRRVPRLVYWGGELTGETDESLRAIVLASRESLEGNAPDDESRTGIIPLESDGWRGRPALVGHRGNGESWSPRFELQEVDQRKGTTTFTLTDPAGRLDLAIEVELLPQGVARFRATLTNTAEDDYSLDELGIVLPVPLEANELLDMTGRWGKERHPQRRDIQVALDMREGRHGRTGFDAPDVTFVGPKGFDFQSGEVWGFHTAFSGNHRVWVQKLLSGEQCIGGSELLLPGEVQLGRDEQYRTPWFYAVHGNGLDDPARRVHAWLRSRPSHPKTPRPVTLNVWEAVYFHHDLAQLQNLADLAASIGVERYVLDDGWFLGRRNDFAGLGDWYVDPEVWPNGLGPIADYVHHRGMQFGLWFEPEMISLDSDLARRHPDWILGARSTSDPEDLPVSWRHQQVLNLSVPEAYEYIRDRVTTLVHQYGIDYIKWDMNRDIIDGGDLTHGGRASVHNQTLAYYRLVDDIKDRCPGLEIESCASGGGRIDLEVMQHADRVWVSDCIDPVERQEMVRWLHQIIPPELMGTHVASPHSHTTGRWSNMAMRGGTALWGHFGIEWDIASAHPDEVRELAEWIEYYKANREFLHSGDLVRCVGPDDSIWLQGVVSPEKTRALFQMVTRHRSSVAPRGRLRFAGLDPEKTYRIRPKLVGSSPSGLVGPAWFGVDSHYESTNQHGFDSRADIPGTVMTGRALANAGVATPRLHPDQVLLFEISAD